MKIPVLLLLALLLAAPVALAKPNVIFILADDLGYGDVGWAWQTKRSVNEARIFTPNLDRLANEGVILTDHYCAAPVCAPSRASILTGAPQPQCSVTNNMFDCPIAEKDTLATVMKAGGYRTMAIGKWGVGGGGESGRPVTAHPLDKGFDTYYGFLDHMAGHTYYHYEGFIRGAYMGLWNGREKATRDGEGVYSTDLFVARAKKDIEDAVKEDPARPFFLYLAVNTVHGSGQCDDTLAEKHPLHVPGRPYPAEGVVWPLAPEPRAARNTWIDPRYRGLKNENMRRYATAVSRLDDAIADLMRHLEKLGIADNTIVVFTSDNGPAKEYGADPRFFQSAGPFRGKKRDVLEGGMRVPTFVWKRGGFGRKTDAMPSQATDWMPTLAAIAGVKAPTGRPGVSLLPRWETSAEKPDDSQISTSYRFTCPQRMVRLGDCCILSVGENPLEVYDVRKDPAQSTNLVDGISADAFPWPDRADEQARRAWMRENLK